MVKLAFVTVRPAHAIQARTLTGLPIALDPGGASEVTVARLTAPPALDVPVAQVALVALTPDDKRETLALAIDLVAFDAKGASWVAITAYVKKEHTI